LQIKGQIKAKFVKGVNVTPREMKTDHTLKLMSSEREKDRKKK
jgi:hypothetical protein